MKKLFLILSVFTLLLTACDDFTDDNNNSDQPVKNVTLPSDPSPLNPTTPVTINGEGFLSTDQIQLRPSTKAENTTIQATVTGTTQTTLTFTIPATTSGTFEIILLRNAKQYTLGKLTFETPKAQEQKLYVSNRWKDEKSTYQFQLLKLNINTGAETIVATQEGITGIHTSAYIPATKEYAGIIDKGLIKINLQTGKTTTVPTSLPQTTGYNRMIVDENSNIYVCKKDDSNNTSKCQIVKIDRNTGTETFVADLEGVKGLDGAAYIPATKEYVGIIDEGFIKINLTTGKTTIVPISLPQATQYDEMIVDENSNIYLCKKTSSNNTSKCQIVKVDKNTGAETFIANLEGVIGVYGSAYLSSTKEYAGIVKAGLVKVNLTTGKTTIVPLAKPGYEEMIAD